MENNIDMAKLMSMLAKVDKKDLQKSMEKANEIMNSKDKNAIIEELKKNLNH